MIILSMSSALFIICKCWDKIIFFAVMWIILYKTNLLFAMQLAVEYIVRHAFPFIFKICISIF